MAVNLVMPESDADPKKNKFWQRLFFYASVFLAIFMFYQSALAHGLTWGNWAEVFLFLSPCSIFFVTTLVYYEFIIHYTDEIAGLSVLGLFAALYCCLRLSEATQADWETHLKYLYLLFASYVIWDCGMVGWLLPEGKNPHRQEIEVLSTHINQPTLMAILLTWAVAHHVSADIAKTYVDGVVSFHLLFAFIACLRSLAYWRLKW